MQISELSAVSGVSVASIKFYRREGLLPPGIATATNRATYADHHVRRLRLIRALIEVGELPIANVRAVLAAVDNESTTLHDAFGAVMHSLDPAPPADPSDSTADAEIIAVNEWLARRAWQVEPHAPAIRTLAQLLVAIRQFDFAMSITDFDEAADLAEQTAYGEVAYARATTDRASAVATMLIGTVVIERVLVEIRRLALEAVSARLEAEVREP